MKKQSSLRSSSATIFCARLLLLERLGWISLKKKEGYEVAVQPRQLDQERLEKITGQSNAENYAFDSAIQFYLPMKEN